MAEADLVVARELATHAAEIRHLQEDMNKLLVEMAHMSDSLVTISSTLSEARGGWKVLMLVGGAGGALGAIISQVIHSIPVLSK